MQLNRLKLIMVTITIEEREFIEKTIRSCKECFVGMIDLQGHPYVIPMNFGYKNDVIYLHSAPEGTSIAAIEINPNVCITFCSENRITYQNEEVACSYRVQGSSVICRGKVSFVEDCEKKAEALNIIMGQYTEKEFTYSHPAVKNVKIWKIEIDNVSAKIFGVPYKESHNYIL